MYVILTGQTITLTVPKTDSPSNSTLSLSYISAKYEIYIWSFEGLEDLKVIITSV